MKNAIMPLFLAFGSISAYASPVALNCTVTESFGPVGQVQHQTYAVSSTDTAHGGFTSGETTGFYSQSHTDAQIYLSTITQVVDGKNWIQAVYYRGTADIVAHAEDFDHVKITLGPDDAGVPGESFEADCSAK